MYLYIPLTEHLCSPEIGPYTSYGILALKKTGDEFVYIEYLSDVFTDRNAVVGLTELCTREQLYPVHLRDVIDDMLYSG